MTTRTNTRAYPRERGLYAWTISQFLADDHHRLANFLRRVLTRSVEVESATYAEFRTGLLKHLATILPSRNSRLMIVNRFGIGSFPLKRLQVDNDTAGFEER